MQLPGPLRAAVGLAANAADEVRRLPDRAVELPMLAVSTVLQMSLRAQQRYARLTARGDEIIGGRPTDEPPAWATFDDPLPPEELDLLSRDGGQAALLLDQLFGREASSDADDPSDAGAAEMADDDLVPPTPIRSARGSAAKRTAGTKTAATKAATTKAPTSKAKAAAAPTKKAVAKSEPPRPASAKSATKRSTGAHEAPRASSGKKVSKPRHTAPSKFDDAAFDDPDAEG